MNAISEPGARLRIEDAGAGVRLLTLDRPAKRNAIDQALFAELIAAFRALDKDASVGAAVLTGAGPAFCAGVDLNDVGDAEVLAERRRTGLNPPAVLLGVETPVIAAVNGPCVTGGLELALACDFILAAESAVFADTHLKLGLLPSWGCSALLPEAVGARRAKELSLTGRAFSAAEALDYGLVASVVAGDGVLDAALDLARGIAALPAEKVAAFLSVVDQGVGRDRAERLQMEREALLRTSHDADHRNHLDL